MRTILISLKNINNDDEEDDGGDDDDDDNDDAKDNDNKDDDDDFNENNCENGDEDEKEVDANNEDGYDECCIFFVALMLRIILKWRDNRMTKVIETKMTETTNKRPTYHMLTCAHA